MTRNKRLVVEDEDRVALEKQIVVKDGIEKKKEEATDVTSQESEKPITVEKKEINDQEKEIEVEKENENEEKEKVEKKQKEKRKSQIVYVEN